MLLERWWLGHSLALLLVFQVDRLVGLLPALLLVPLLLFQVALLLVHLLLFQVGLLPALLLVPLLVCLLNFQ
jgi:hypothetical protein|tara:strand:+ start:118 stop:333 length:216 start_codon:yes stop_codon:yes gene_type:complete